MIKLLMFLMLVLPAHAMAQLNGGPAATVDTTGLATGVDQGASTTGVDQTMAGGAVTTVAPSYTNATVQPLSLTEDGALRIDGSFSPAAAADTVGTTVSITGGTSANASVALAGQQRVEVTIAAGTLAATLVAEISRDGGTTWAAASFYDAVDNSGATTIVSTNPNSAYTRDIAYFGAISHARVRASAYTSGAADATLRAVAGSVYSILATRSSASASVLAMPRTDSAGRLQTYDNSVGQLTGTTNSGYAVPMAGVNNYVDAINRPVIVDDTGNMATTNTNGAGAAAVNIQDGGNTITVDGTVTITDGAGAVNVIIDSGTTTVTQGTGTNLHTVVDSGSITVGNAAGASAVNIQDGGNTITVDGTVTATVTGATVSGSAGSGASTNNINPVLMSAISGNVNTPIIQCGLTATININSAGVTQILAPSTGKTHHVCYYEIVAATTATVVFENGATASCASGTSNAGTTLRFVAQTGTPLQGVTGGSGLGSIMDSGGQGRSFCIRSTAAVQVDGMIRYTTFGFGDNWFTGLLAMLSLLLYRQHKTIWPHLIKNKNSRLKETS